MIIRWSTPALMGVLAAALLLTPTRANAQVFAIPGGYGGFGYGGYGGYGGFGGFGYPRYGGFGWGGLGYGGYGGFGGGGLGYGGYGGFGWGGYGYRPYYTSFYYPGPVVPLNYSYTPFGYNSLPPLGNSGLGYQGRGYGSYAGGMGNAGTYPGMPGLPVWAAPIGGTTPRMRSTLEPAVRIPARVLLAANTDTAAHIEVRLPTANAVVLVQGAATTQTGTLREFVSPPLAPGTYTYTIQASWTAQGQQHNQKRTVSVSPGQRRLVDFTTVP